MDYSELNSFVHSIDSVEKILIILPKRMKRMVPHYSKEFSTQTKPSAFDSVLLFPVTSSVSSVEHVELCTVYCFQLPVQ